MRVLGLLLVLLGIIGAGHFWSQDTSVEVPETTIMGQTVGGGRVNNLGLMQDRQNGLLVCVGASVVGAILMAVAPKPATASKTDATNPSPHSLGGTDTKTTEDRLARLKELRDSGTISDEEYEQRRATILDEI